MIASLATIHGASEIKVWHRGGRAATEASAVKVAS
jgi:hypothetical protein